MHHSGIAVMLKRLGYTHKKKSLFASERNRARVKQRRSDWLKHRIPAIAQVCELFDPKECSNYFSAAGYKSN